MDIIYQEYIHSNKTESIIIKFNNGYEINKGVVTKQIIYIKIIEDELIPIQIVDNNHNITEEGGNAGFFLINNVIHRNSPDYKIDKRTRLKMIYETNKSDIIYSNILNLFFDKMYIINLKQDTLKRDIFIRNNKEHNLHFDFIEGIEGNKDDHCEVLLNAYLSKPLKYKGCSPQEIQYNSKMLKNRAQVGYLKSMLKVFEDAKSNSYEYIIIFDDDVLLSNDFCKTFYNKLTIIPPRWDILRLGSNWTSINKNLDHVGNKPFYKTIPCDGSYAVAYNKNVFQYMINKIQEFNVTFDTGALRNYKMNDYTLYPNIAIPDVFSSSITNNHFNITDYAKKRMWNLSLYTFKSSLRKISVIIITYNNTHTIINSIKSILNQVYSNIEIIIVDNNSSDDTFQKISKIHKQYSNMRIIKLETTMSIYRIKNDTIKQCTGDYITYHGPTSFALPNRLVTQINDIIRYGCQVTFTSIIKSSMNLGQIEDISQIEYMIRNQINTNVKFDHTSILFDKKLFTDFGYSKSDNDLEYLFELYKNKYSKHKLSITEFHYILTKKDPNSLIYYNSMVNCVTE